ncbi:MAG: PD-(D/E)XK nuclease family protein, partial [Chloroflexota bacterium]|nr:PD-(D/E)XK nuclease family protein [Chloroflexota bacterium]
MAGIGEQGVAADTTVNMAEHPRRAVSADTAGRRQAPAAKVALPVLDRRAALPLSPTDIAQYIRLEQCQRYLRLRLHERAVDRHFMRDYGVTPQSIPPLLTRSGATFEEQIERAVREHFPALNFATETGRGQGWADDNARVVAEARALSPGETLVLFQPRLEVELDGWRLRGDVDILRLERDRAGALQILIADMKSSTSAKVEHRLQVAFYHEMLAHLFTENDLAYAAMTMAVLYRGPADGDAGLSVE